jgi:signal transduction histidine kinase
VNFNANIRGTLKILPDTTASLPVEPPLAIALLLLLREARSDYRIRNTLSAALREAQMMSDDERQALLDQAGLTGIIEHFAAEIKAENGKVPKKGSVTATLLVSHQQE